MIESLLTGESVPIEKNTKTIKGINVPIGDRKNSCFMSTTVVKVRDEVFVYALCGV